MAFSTTLCLPVAGVWCCFFFFKQKTAYEIGTGDWSSDVCSSDLLLAFNKRSKIKHCLEILSLSLKYESESCLLEIQPIMRMSSAYLITATLLTVTVILSV